MASPCPRLVGLSASLLIRPPTNTQRVNHRTCTRTGGWHSTLELSLNNPQSACPLVHSPLWQPRLPERRINGSSSEEIAHTALGPCGDDATMEVLGLMPPRLELPTSHNDGGSAQNWPLLTGVSWLGLGSPAATPTLLAQSTEKSSPLRRTVPFPQQFASPCVGPPSILGILRRRMERNPLDGKDTSDSGCGCPHWDSATTRLGPAIGTPSLAIAAPPTLLLEEGPASWSAIPMMDTLFESNFAKWDPRSHQESLALLHLCFNGDSLLCSFVGHSKGLHLWSVHPNAASNLERHSLAAVFTLGSWNGRIPKDLAN